MKKYLISISLVLIISIGAYLFLSHKSNYTIEGKINVDSTTIYLKGFRNKMFYTVDSARVVNGTFSFKGSVRRPELFGLTTDRNESFSQLAARFESTESGNLFLKGIKLFRRL